MESKEGLKDKEIKQETAKNKEEGVKPKEEKGGFPPASMNEPQSIAGPEH